MSQNIRGLLVTKKLDPVGPCDDRPTTSTTIYKTNMTCDTWQVICDKWHVTHGGGWTIYQNFNSLALTVWDFWCLEDWEEKDQSVNE